MSRRTVAPHDFGWLSLAKAFWYLLDNYRKQYLLWTGFICFVYFYTLVPPILIAMIINFFTQYQMGDSLQYFYAVAVFWGLSYSLISVLRLTAKNHLGAIQSHVEYEARVHGFDKLTDLSIEWNDTESSGNKVQRIVSGLALFTQLQRMMHQNGFQTIVTLVGLLAFFAFTSIYFVLFFVAYCTLFVVINLIYVKRKDILINELNQAKEQSSGKYFEGLSNIMTIKTLGAQNSFNKSIMTSEEVNKNYRIKFIALLKKTCVTKRSLSSPTAPQLLLSVT